MVSLSPYQMVCIAGLGSHNPLPGGILQGIYRISDIPRQYPSYCPVGGWQVVPGILGVVSS